ncbi:MAG: phosphoribosylformylglycinamidine synthase II [candidate division Zixibacteria bacterium RBG_16_48_11]|nr:MAG: phosphoribosylformylglycinamidine synthase II [candidate division Zixibacteria bacterium RBG_16_48_11]
MPPKSNLPKEPQITWPLAKEHGLTREEYNRILKILSRKPTYTELGIFSVMWSEHCSYKNSIAVLKKLPRAGRKLLVKTGEENAGAIDIGDGLAVVFKIESHNHPSAVEPYQGAATGVGGIMRDVFTMGARPIACLNSLRFGELDSSRARYLFDGVVRGIGDYGNSFGVPTIAGEVYFENCYLGNPLVNAMAVGLVKHKDLALSRAKGEGNPVLIVGSSTGRDGIHGATFASEEISEKSEQKRPSVQIGDPFMEKLLLEATLEALKTGYIVAIQDMGAAGLTCCSSEMSAKGKVGMEIDLSQVPVREEKMTPYEIMLSESQERMLVVARKDKVKQVQKIFSKWGLNSTTIGHVTNGDRLMVRNNGQIVADIPADTLVLGGGAPVYQREKKRPGYLDKVQNLKLSDISEPEDYNEILLRLLHSSNIANKRWVYQQYDTSVRTNTILGPGSDAAVLRVRNTNQAIAVKTDGNARYTYLDPRTGGKIAVAEAARNVVCSGGKPLGITNCLNFGNPYDQEVFWTFYESVMGMGEACRVLETPVTGGNVSFYNEDLDKKSAVYPTVVVGMVGLLEDVSYVTTAWFKEPGDVIVLLGKNKEEIGGSEYLKVIHHLVKGKPPGIELQFEKRLQKACSDAIRAGIIKSAHDCSEGGLAVALAECCIGNQDKMLGAEIVLKDKIRTDTLLFGETQSRIIVSLEEENQRKLEKICKKYKLPYQVIGKVDYEQRLGIEVGNQELISLSCEEMGKRYYHSIERMMSGLGEFD